MANIAKHVVNNLDHFNSISAKAGMDIEKIGNIIFEEEEEEKDFEEDWRDSYGDLRILLQMNSVIKMSASDKILPMRELMLRYSVSFPKKLEKGEDKLKPCVRILKQLFNQGKPRKLNLDTTRNSFWPMIQSDLTNENDRKEFWLRWLFLCTRTRISFEFLKNNQVHRDKKIPGEVLCFLEDLCIEE